MKVQQTRKAQKRRKALMKRWAIFTFWTVAFIVGGIAWLLSSGRILPYELSFAVSALLLVCGLVLTLGAWLFPLQPVGLEVKSTSRISLTLATDLRPESLNLGGNEAAKFPYIIAPIEKVYNETIQALTSAADDTARTKRGILIIGESNAGKTRLAFESLKQVLPTWPVLHWMPNYLVDDVLTEEINSSKRLVIFIDDLQNYLSTQMMNDSSATLRAVLETLFQSLECVVVVATCRLEDKSHVQATLNWLFMQLLVVTMPTFSTNNQDPQVIEAITKFHEKGNIHVEDWDGTLGSLVLGLSTKNSQYLKLAESYPLAATVLKAMKLLTAARTTFHTERRIQAICAHVFGKDELQKKDIWREALERLTLLQFVTIDNTALERSLVIRKDVYFEKVVTDYSQDNSSNQIELDFKPLSEVLVELQDADALSHLGLALLQRQRPKEALEVCDKALSFDPQSSFIGSLKSSILLVLKRNEEALALVNQVISLDPENVSIRVNKGTILSELNRYNEALEAFNEALALDPTYILALTNKGKALMNLNRDEEALEALNRALALDPQNSYTWFNKGLALAHLDRYEEALDAFNHTLTSTHLTWFNELIDVWMNKGVVLENLDRYEEALDAFNHALSLNPISIDSWLHKGRILAELNRYEEALDAFNHALSHDLRDSSAQCQ